MEPRPGEERPHLPPPSLWPIGFAIGIVCILVGLIVSWPAVAVGATPTGLFAFLWVPEGQYVVATFMRNPEEGEISRRTAYVRNNGFVGGKPSFTVLSNRCAHLGCPVQPNGPMFNNKKTEAKTKSGEVTLIPTLPAGGFGCPCHGGQYDSEGNRTAGPPVRALDRYEFSVRNGHLILGQPYSVGEVIGSGASAKIKKYRLTGPGEH